MPTRIRRPTDISPPPTTVRSEARPAARAEGTRGATDGFDLSGMSLKKAVGSFFTGVVDRYVERPFAVGRDGFVAVNADGSVAGGREAGAIIRDRDMIRTGTRLDGVFNVIADTEDRQVTFTLPGGAKVVDRTGDDGKERLPMSAFAGRLSGQGQGQLLEVGISTPNGEPGEARMLALPTGYDGPVFFCDIDDTLRDTSITDVVMGNNQPPIAGARELLSQVAAAGVPIVYLSAGTDRIRTVNGEFLKQFPPGILLDREDFGVKDVLGSNETQALNQGAYKAEMMAQFKRTFPRAQLFGLGDDQYGDAIAYTQQGARAYIRDARPGEANLPADFTGVVTREYDAAFVNRVKADLDAAKARSSTFGGTPAQTDVRAERNRKLDQLTQTTATTGNKVELLVNGEQAFPEMLKAIDQAKDTIYYETFELHAGDRTAKQLVDRLEAAVKRGVRVRVVADALGSQEIPPFKRNALLEQLRVAGADVRVHNPIDSVKDLDFSRDHRKVLVSDGKVGFVSGMNTGDRYLGGPEVKDQYHDLALKLNGPALNDVMAAFADSWRDSGKGEIPPGELARLAKNVRPTAGEGVSTRIIARERGGVDNLRQTYLTMMNSAQKQLYVQNDFPIDDDMISAMKAAAARGVDVRYVIGQSVGKFDEALDVLNRRNFQSMLDAGVRIYVYPEPIHSKVVSVDGEMATVGSGNLDHVALSRNREIIAVVDDPRFVRELDRRVFEKDFVGEPQGKKTVELPRKLSDSGWDRFKAWLLDAVFPDSFE